MNFGISRAYQQIKIEDVHIKGHDRSSIYKWIFPNGPKRLKILDIASSVGYYSIQACYDDAASALGIEISEKFVDVSNKIVEHLKLYNAEFVCADITKFETDETFDVVLCLSLLHHLRTLENIDLVMEKCNKWSRDRMVFILYDTHTPGALFENVNPREGYAGDFGLSVDYLKQTWPEYTYTISKDLSHVPKRGRTIVDVRK